MEATMTETPQTPTDGATTSEAPATDLLTGSEAAGTQQAAETTQVATTEETKTAETPAGAPEKYELKAPEGKTYDAAVMTSFEAAARTANLSQEAAQKVMESMAPALAERQAEQIKAVQTGWVQASQTDKEFGGEKLKENLGIARTALDKFGTPELNALLKDAGLGNHPEVIRFNYRVGKAMSDDSFVSGSASAGEARRIQDILYDKTGA